MTQFVEPEEKQVLSHESYGMIRVSRMHGHAELFGVDYPQGHSIRLEISTAELHIEGTRQMTMPRKIVCQVDMTEVQYARMIATPNTTGVPCTLRAALDGNLKTMENPPRQPDPATRNEALIKDIARRVGGNMAALRDMLETMAAGGSVTKAQIRDAAQLAQQTQQAIESDMPYMTERMAEDTTRREHAAKTEIDAYIQQSLAELGRQTLIGGKEAGGLVMRIGSSRRQEEETGYEE